MFEHITGHRRLLRECLRFKYTRYVLKAPGNIAASVLKQCAAYELPEQPLYKRFGEGFVVVVVVLTILTHNTMRSVVAKNKYINIYRVESSKLTTWRSAKSTSLRLTRSLPVLILVLHAEMVWAAICYYARTSYVMSYYAFRTSVPFWGQTIQIICSLSPKRDCCLW